jgi:hypothetical protein
MLVALEPGEYLDTAVATSNDNRQRFVSQLSVLTLVVTAIFFLRWTYLANRNAHSLTVASMKYTPGWAVGWHFIPIASLWKPYRAMQEMFRASDPARSNGEVPKQAPRIVSVWWLAWILWWIGGGYLNMRISKAETYDEFILASKFGMITGVLSISVAAIGTVLVGSLTSKQQIAYSKQSEAAI